jgi:adenine-specific DNA-methyltransferase
MVVPLTTSPAVDTATVTAFLNTNAADRVFRCINGSVAVSAYELESMPLPSTSAMSGLARLVEARASRIEIERFCDRLYGAP